MNVFLIFIIFFILCVFLFVIPAFLCPGKTEGSGILLASKLLLIFNQLWQPIFLSCIALLFILSGGAYYLSGGGIKYMDFNSLVVSPSGIKESINDKYLTKSNVGIYILSIKYHLINNSGDILLWEALGKLSLHNRDVDTALISYNQAYMISPDYNHKILYVRALIEKNTYESLGKSQNMLEDMLADYPDNISLMEMLSASFFLQKKYPSAISIWSKMMGLLNVNDYRYDLLKIRIQNANKKLNYK